MGCGTGHTALISLQHSRQTPSLRAFRRQSTQLPMPLELVGSSVLHTATAIHRGSSSLSTATATSLVTSESSRATPVTSSATVVWHMQTPRINSLKQLQSSHASQPVRGVTEATRDVPTQTPQQRLPQVHPPLQLSVCPAAGRAIILSEPSISMANRLHHGEIIWRVLDHLVDSVRPATVCAGTEFKDGPWTQGPIQSCLS
mmetsp:Transcript_9090/g.12742  ORF Transcript_9090/g.12742 Transcript_9090/m.12742 type:complete len:201 (+) Transcript_9090:257-859(+)